MVQLSKEKLKEILALPNDEQEAAYQSHYEDSLKELQLLRYSPKSRSDLVGILKELADEIERYRAPAIKGTLKKGTLKKRLMAGTWDQKHFQSDMKDLVRLVLKEAEQKGFIHRKELAKSAENFLHFAPSPPRDFRLEKTAWLVRTIAEGIWWAGIAPAESGKGTRAARVEEARSMFVQSQKDNPGDKKEYHVARIMKAMHRGRTAVFGYLADDVGGRVGPRVISDDERRNAGLSRRRKRGT